MPSSDSSLSPLDPTDPTAIELAYAELLAAPADADTLRRWGELDAAIEHHGSGLYLQIHRRPTDDAAQSAYARWAGAVRPLADARGSALAARYPDPPPSHRGFVARYAARLQRAPDPDIAAREQALQQRYVTTLRGLWPIRMGDRELDRPAFVAVARSSDRGERERAWRARDAALERLRDEVDALYTELCAVRHALAASAGFPTHRELRYRELGRDWGPDHAAVLRGVVERTVVPAVTAMTAYPARERGLVELAPWDDDVSVEVEVPPYATLLDHVGRCVARLGPDAAAIWDDLRPRIDHIGPEPRQVANFHRFSFVDRRSTLFLAPGGGPWDLATLLHEVGHALHHTSSGRAHPGFLTDPPMEVGELAAIGHELLQLAVWSEVFGPAVGARFRASALRRAAILVVDAALWDAYQDWAATHPDHGVAERRAQWVALVARFKPDHCDGAWAATWEGARLRADVPYLRPFYALEYAMAALGALQLAERHARDPDGATAAYLGLLRGGLAPSAEAYALAGVSWLPDDRATRAVMDWVVASA